MSVLVCESILGYSFMADTLSAGSGMFVQREYERGNDTQAYHSVRTSETTLPKHTYSGGVCVHTDTLSASFRYGRVTVLW